jgi:hypothetical protein
VTFEIPPGHEGEFVGYGGWFQAPQSVSCKIVSENASAKYTLSAPAAPNWGKLGSMWISNGRESGVKAVFRADADSTVGLWRASCGVIEHPHLKASRAELLNNMYQFSPEAHFYSTPGRVAIIAPARKGRVAEIARARISLKSCNRCGRFLPINLDDEQKHLSFSNHCKAPDRRPCKHGSFGTLTDVDTNDSVRLEFGFQLECRFCKKFEVNAALNPQRNAAQMKEDGARRRFFELLLTELYGESAQLRYRHQTGRELPDDVWKRFERSCFKCKTRLPTPRDMNLDHTRPLALLWPLDETATALCGSCNSEKRDRPPILVLYPRGTGPTLNCHRDSASGAGGPQSESCSAGSAEEADRLVLRGLPCPSRANKGPRRQDCSRTCLESTREGYQRMPAAGALQPCCRV